MNYRIKSYKYIYLIGFCNSFRNNYISKKKLFNNSNPRNNFWKKMIIVLFFSTHQLPQKQNNTNAFQIYLHEMYLEELFDKNLPIMIRIKELIHQIHNLKSQLLLHKNDGLKLLLDRKFSLIEYAPNLPQKYS